MKRANLPLFLQILFVAAFFIVWEASVRAGWIDAHFVASPSQAFYTLATEIASGRFIKDFGFTFTEIAIAYGLALSLGIGSGLIIGTAHYLREVFDPIVMALFSLPKITFFPLFMLWFGVGIDSKIAYGAFAGFFPIVINTIAGVKEVNPHYISAARIMGANSTQLYGKVIIPSLIPIIFSGLRIGLITVGVSVVVTEMIVSPAGLGQEIIDLANKLQPGPVYSLIILLSAIMMTLNYILLRIERRQDRYRG